MNTKHTPGPWSFQTPKEGTPDITIQTRIQTTGPHSKSGQTIPLYITRVYGTGENFGPINQERLANARLIASAPELLEALKALLQADQMECKQGSDEELRKIGMQVNAEFLATLAIAKAEGEE